MPYAKISNSKNPLTHQYPIIITRQLHLHSFINLKNSTLDDIIKSKSNFKMFKSSFYKSNKIIKYT